MPTTLTHLHRGDMFVRNRLVDELSSRRTALGISQRGLAQALGVTRNSVMTVEKQRPANPKVATLVTRGEPLRMRLHLALAGLPEVACPHADLLLACGFLGESMAVRLRAVREHLDISRRRFEAEHGWKWSSLAAFELAHSTPMLAQLQRYARALDGSLDARWEVL